MKPARYGDGPAVVPTTPSPSTSASADAASAGTSTRNVLFAGYAAKTRAERVGAADLDRPEDAVPDGLHARSVGVRLAREPVAVAVVDLYPDLMSSRRQLRQGINVRRRQRIAAAERLSVPERLAFPHHALEEELPGNAAVRLRQLDRPRPDGLADVLPFLDQRLGLRRIQRRAEVVLGPARPETGLRQRSRQDGRPVEVRPGYMPGSAQVNRT